MNTTQWEVRAGRTQQAVLDGQCDFIDLPHDFSKDARERAKYVLTDDFQRIGEMSAPFTYSQVVKLSGPSWDRKEEVVADFFRKESK